jgi:hypothetical protein
MLQQLVFMLQVFYLGVSCVSHTCCKCIFQMFHPFSYYVAFKCFFHVASVLRCLAEAKRGWRTRALGASGQGCCGLGRVEGVRESPAWRVGEKERGQGKGQRTQRWKWSALVGGAKANGRGLRERPDACFRLNVQAPAAPLIHRQ